MQLESRARPSRKFLWLGVATLVPVLPALAQEPAQVASGEAVEETGGHLEDIVVTARRRAEASQDVPVAVSAFSADMLSERRIGVAQDLQGQVPSLAIGSSGQARANESFTLRGQGTTFLSAAGVVTYFAESPLVPGLYVSTQGPPGMMLDLANIQVLRGPQGTLFGRNTTGGAVLLEPARPKPDPEGYVQAELGNYGKREVEAVVNLPLADNLAVRAAARYTKRDGYTRDIVNNRDYDDREYFTGRVSLLWNPTDRIETYLVAYGTDSSDNGSGFILGDVNATMLNARFAAAGGCAGVGLGANCSVLTGLVADQRQRGARKVAGFSNSYSKIRGWGVNHHLSVELGDTLTLRNVLSYGELRSDMALNADGMAINLYTVTGNKPYPIDNLWQVTEELQLQGTARGDHLQYTLGFYADQLQTSGLQGQNSLVSLGSTLSLRAVKRNSYAGYVQATYDLGDLAQGLEGLSLTAGIRQTWDRATGYGASYRFLPGGKLLCANGASANPQTEMDCAAEGAARSDALTWTFGADYKLADGVLLYAKASRGYKMGGINYGAVNMSNFSFEPEFVKTYEGGVKSDFRIAEAPTRLNVTVFKTLYDDIQRAAGDFNFQNLASGSIVINAASATIRGIEVETQVQPVRGVSLSGNYSFLDAGYDDFVFPALGQQYDCTGTRRSGPIDLSCIPFQYTPRHQFSVNGTFDLPIPAEAGNMNLSLTYSYIGRQYSAASTLEADEPGAWLASYGVMNGSLNWRGIMGSSVDGSLFVTNLFDKLYRTTNTNVFQSIGVQSSLYGEPRMWGIRLRYNWGN